MKRVALDLWRPYPRAGKRLMRLFRRDESYWTEERLRDFLGASWAAGIEPGPKLAADWRVGLGPVAEFFDGLNRREKAVLRQRSTVELRACLTRRER